MNTRNVHLSDLEKVRDAVSVAARHHHHRDAANAALHMAEAVRPSPLTSELHSALERLDRIVAGGATASPELAASLAPPRLAARLASVPLPHVDLGDGDGDPA